MASMAIFDLLRAVRATTVTLQLPTRTPVQPQCSMKEPLPDMTLTLTIDRMTSSCRASSKSTSLELLLHLHAIVGAAALRR